MEGLLPETFQHREVEEANLSASSEPDEVEALQEEKLPASLEWRKYFPPAPEAVEEALFLAYQKALEVEGGNKKFISEILKAGTGGRKYQAATAYLKYLCQKHGR